MLAEVLDQPGLELESGVVTAEEDAHAAIMAGGVLWPPGTLER
jgi:hypothetical protein